MVALKRAQRCRVVFCLSLLLCLLGQEDSLDVWEYTTLGNGDTRQKLVQLLVIPNGELEMPGDDPGLLVVTGSITGQLEDLGSKVLHDSSQVNRGTSTHTLRIVALAEETMYTSHGELEASPVGTGLCFSLDLAALAASRHDVENSLFGRVESRERTDPH